MPALPVVPHSSFVPQTSEGEHVPVTAALSPSTDYFAVGCQDGVVLVYQAVTNQLVRAYNVFGKSALFGRRSAPRGSRKRAGDAEAPQPPGEAGARAEARVEARAESEGEDASGGSPLAPKEPPTKKGPVSSGAPDDAAALRPEDVLTPATTVVTLIWGPDSQSLIAANMVADLKWISLDPDTSIVSLSRGRATHYVNPFCNVLASVSLRSALNNDTIVLAALAPMRFTLTSVRVPTSALITRVVLLATCVSSFPLPRTTFLLIDLGFDACRVSTNLTDSLYDIFQGACAFSRQFSWNGGEEAEIHAPEAPGAASDHESRSGTSESLRPRSHPRSPLPTSPSLSPGRASMKVPCSREHDPLSRVSALPLDGEHVACFTGEVLLLLTRLSANGGDTWALTGVAELDGGKDMRRSEGRRVLSMEASRAMASAPLWFYAIQQPGVVLPLLRERPMMYTPQTYSIYIPGHEGSFLSIRECLEWLRAVEAPALVTPTKAQEPARPSATLLTCLVQSRTLVSVFVACDAVVDQGAAEADAGLLLYLGISQEAIDRIAEQRRELSRRGTLAAAQPFCTAAVNILPGQSPITSSSRFLVSAAVIYDQKLTNAMAPGTPLQLQLAPLMQATHSGHPGPQVPQVHLGTPLGQQRGGEKEGDGVKDEDEEGNGVGRGEDPEMRPKEEAGAEGEAEAGEGPVDGPRARSSAKPEYCGSQEEKGKEGVAEGLEALERPEKPERSEDPWNLGGPDGHDGPGGPDGLDRADTRASTYDPAEPDHPSDTPESPANSAQSKAQPRGRSRAQTRARTRSRTTTRTRSRARTQSRSRSRSRARARGQTRSRANAHLGAKLGADPSSLAPATLTPGVLSLYVNADATAFVVAGPKELSVYCGSPLEAHKAVYRSLVFLESVDIRETPTGEFVFIAVGMMPRRLPGGKLGPPARRSVAYFCPQPVQNYDAFCPQFVALSNNVLYVEREDEYDLETDPLLYPATFPKRLVDNRIGDRVLGQVNAEDEGRASDGSGQSNGEDEDIDVFSPIPSSEPRPDLQEQLPEDQRQLAEFFASSLASIDVLSIRKR